MDQYEAFERATALADDLARIVDRDPEQEVQGIAVPVLDALLAACREFVPNDPVVQAIDGLLVPEAAEDHAGLRAIDTLLVVRQLGLALKSGLEFY